MGDYWPEEWTKMELQVMRDCPQHRFYTLTKQPQNLAKFSPFPDNCWVGMTACNDDMFNDAVWSLSAIEAKVKYLSLEPLLASTVAGILDNHRNWPVIHGGILSHVINWVIIGAQTRPTVYPKIEWVREIVEACDRARIPVFLKDNLDPLLGQDHRFKRWLGKDNEENTIVGLRQELPE